MNITLPVKKETEQLIRLALPIILSSLLQMTYNIIDMIWVGHLGSAEIAAVGTAGFYIKLGWAISSVITMGAMVLVSHNVGSNDKRALQTYISTSVNAIIAMGALYSLVMLFLPQY
ncbi:MAG: MATE family efflux transporter, partial [Tannerellaceae bacterium]